MQAAGSPSASGGGGDASAAESSNIAADLLYTQNLLLKRNAEVSELEQSLRELRSRVRSLEEAEERSAAQLRQHRDGESAALKKLETASRERVEALEELALVKEKRERERQRLAEREERERDAKLASTTAASESAAQLVTVRADLDAANAKVAELQDSLADKQSKVSEQQDKLNALTRSNETLTREHAEMREQAAALAAKLESQAAAAATQLAQADAEKNSLSAELRRLSQEHDALTARRMVFDGIAAESLASARDSLGHKDRTAVALLDGLVKKVEFYEDQLLVADESMLQAKQAWLASALVLQDQVEKLQSELAAAKADLSAALESKGLDQARALNLETKLRKAEKDKSKLSELMSRFEVELTAKKVELAASLDQLSTQEYDNEFLKAKLSKQLKLCEGHVAELNRSRG